MVIRILRNITQDFENQDRFFEVHLEPIMADLLESELATIAVTLNEYRENQGFMNHAYKFVQAGHPNCTQYELTTALHINKGCKIHPMCKT